MALSRAAARALAVAGAVVLVLALALALARGLAAARYSAFLGGVWAGDPAFLEEAGLTELQLYVGPAGAGGARPGYLLAADEGGLVENCAFELRPGRGAGAGALLAVRDEYAFPRAAFDWKEGASGAFPGALRLTLSLQGGGLRLDDGAEVYAVLAKDPAATAAADAAWEAAGEAAPI